MQKFPPGWREKAYRAVPELRACHGPDGSVERLKAHDLLLSAIQRTCEERLDCIRRLALPAHVRRERNDQIRKRMQQWAPKRKFVGIALVHHRSIETAPSQVAAGLVEHWAPVFSARPVDEELLQWWMAKLKAPDVEHIQWKNLFRGVPGLYWSPQRLCGRAGWVSARGL